MAKSQDERTRVFITDCPQCDEHGTLHVEIGDDYAETYHATCAAPQGCGFQTDAYQPSDSDEQFQMFVLRGGTTPPIHYGKGVHEQLVRGCTQPDLSELSFAPLEIRPCQPLGIP